MICPYCGSSFVHADFRGIWCLSCLHWIDIDEVTE